MSEVTVIAATLSPTIVPVMATEIKLYNGATEITAASGGNFMSDAGNDTCMANFIATTKAFHVYCTDQTKFKYTATYGKKDFSLTYKLQYV